MTISACNRHMYHVLLLLSIISLWGCERRALEESTIVDNTAIIDVNIDWSLSKIDVSKMHRASVIFYPHDGSKFYEFHLEGDLNSRKVELPVGHYSVLVFNETMDNNDWDAIEFSGVEGYQTIVTKGVVDSRRSLYTRAETETIVRCPEALAVWNMDDLNVTSDMVTYTRSKARSKGDKSRLETDMSIETILEEFTNIQPELLFKEMAIVAHVQNLHSAYAITGAVQNAAGGVYLATGKVHADNVTHMFAMNNRVWDDPNDRKNGHVSATILVFGLHLENDVKTGLQMEFLLNDGTQAPSEQFDITDMIDHETIEIKIEVGTGVNGGDHPIILPEVDAGGDVGVGDWDEEFVEIK